MFLSHDRPLDLQEHPVICTSVWPYFYAFHYKNHTAEYLCSENMFSSTFQWKQTIGTWYVVEECVDLKYVNRVFGHVKPNYGSGLGVFRIHLMSCNQILLLIVVVLYLVYYLGSSIVEALYYSRHKSSIWVCASSWDFDQRNAPYFCLRGIFVKTTDPLTFACNMAHQKSVGCVCFQCTWIYNKVLFHVTNSNMTLLLRQAVPQVLEDERF
jgi:hypothetical protein